MTIDSFKGSYRFLSNFSPVPIRLGGLVFPSVEHAYQAAKTLNLTERKAIRNIMNPGEAKRLGCNVTLRNNWEEMKLTVMEVLVRMKFERPNLLKQLLITYPHELIEGNTWGDTYWGVCRGEGENHLGKILMSIRKDMYNG